MSVQDTEVAEVDADTTEDAATPEVEGTEAEAESTGNAPATKHKLPEGISTPIEFRNHLVAKKHAPADLKPQQVYGWVKSPGKGEARFPVAHYDADGNKFETAQVNEHGVTLTRPGVILAEAVEWYKGYDERKAARQAERAQKAKEKAAKAAAASEKAAAAPAEGEAAVDVPTAEAEVEGAESWDEVEAQ